MERSVFYLLKPNNEPACKYHLLCAAASIMDERPVFSTEDLRLVSEECKNIINNGKNRQVCDLIKAGLFERRGKNDSFAVTPSGLVALKRANDGVREVFRGLDRATKRAPPQPTQEHVDDDSDDEIDDPDYVSDEETDEETESDDFGCAGLGPRSMALKRKRPSSDSVEDRFEAAFREATHLKEALEAAKAAAADAEAALEAAVEDALEIEKAFADAVAAATSAVDEEEAKAIRAVENAKRRRESIPKA